MIKPEDYFDFRDGIMPKLFVDCDYVWDVIPNIRTRVVELTQSMQTIKGNVMEGAYLSPKAIYIEEGAIVEPGAYIEGPAYIASGAVVRHGAYVRENVILFEDSIVGHATEIKNSVLLPGAHAPHFNYVGDSVLGHHCNLGAGTKLSNLTLISEKDSTTGKRPTIKIHIDNEIYDTGLAKMGAILGDGAQTGCNAVLNPGTLIGKNTLVYANMSVRKGAYPADSVLKLRQTTSTMTRRR